MRQPAKRQKRYDETRRHLLEVAWGEFAEKGYAQAATESIVQKAGVTRGALYYHFKDKTALFRAVLELAHTRILEQIEAAANTAPTISDGLRLGCLAFLKACAAPDIQQIALVDGPSVLGWTEWRKIDADHGFGALCAGLREARRHGVLREETDPVALAYLLSGAMNEAVLALSDPGLSKAKRRKLQQSMEESLITMLTAFVGEDV